MNKILIFLILIISLIAVTGFILLQEKDIEKNESTYIPEEVSMIENSSKEQTTSEIETIKDTPSKISLSTLSLHSTKDDCWVVYENKIYDFSNANFHPNMAKTFYEHCGKEKGFESGAKAKHSSSNENRVLNYGEYIGELEI